VTENAGNVSVARQLLQANDLWGAKDHLEREQLSNPSAPGLKELLDEVYGKLAVRSLADNQPSQALAFADKALAIRPDQVELIYTRARAYEALSDNDRAIEGYEKTIALNKGDYQGSIDRVIYLYKVRGQAFVQKGDLQNARTDYLNLLRFAPKDADANYYLGYIALQFKEYDKARKYLDVSVTEPRLERLSQMYYGMVEAETQRWAETVKWMTEARKEEPLRPQTDPYLAAAHYNLGVAALNAKKYDEADARFLDVLRIDPAHKHALFNLALTWDGKGNLQTARDYFQKVRAIQPGYRKVEIGMADVSYRIGVDHFQNARFEKGFDMFMESAAMDPSRGEPHYYLGLTHRQWKANEKALPALETAISRGAFVLESRFEAGEVLFEKQDWRRSIAYLETVEATRPDYKSDKVKGYLREGWWKLAIADIQAKQWAQATEKLKKVLKYPPDLPETHYYMGLAALRQGYYDTAVSELEPTYQALPKDTRVRAALAEAHYHIGVDAYAKGLFKDAHSKLERAYQVDSGNRDVQYQFARAKNRLDRFQEAIPLLEPLARQEPAFRDSIDDLAEAYGGYGEQLLDQKKKRDAQVYLTKALKLNPTEIRALYAVGVIAFEEKRYGEATERLQIVYDRNPEYRRVYSLMVEASWMVGKAAYDKKNQLAARQAFLKVLDLNPNHGDALYHMGDLEVNAKNYEGAKNYFERAINRDTKVVESHYGLGTVLYEEAKFAQAAEHFEETRKRNPTYKNVDSYIRRSLYNEANAQEKLGDFRKASVYLERYFRLEPTSSQVALKMAGFAEKLGDTKKTAEWYETAIPLLKSDADPVRFKLAMLYFKNNEYDKALQTVEKIKSNEGRELKGTIYLAMGQRDRKLGRLSDAQASLKIALSILPNNLDAIYEFGRLRYEMKDYNEAATYLRKAADLNADLPDVMRLTGDAHRKVGADLFKKERLNEADQAYKTSNLYDPSTEADYHIGVIAYLKKDLHTALAQFEQVEKQEPKYQANAKYLADTVCALGEAAEQKNDLANARDLLVRCLASRQSDKDLRYKVAILSFKLRHFDDARRRFRDIVLNYGKTFPEANGYLVDTLFALEQDATSKGDYDLARRYSDEILERAPDNFRAHYALARNLEQLGDLNEAERAIRKALEMRPGDAESVNLLKRVIEAKAAAKPAPATQTR
jgi:tetratricopeptide (TPR) repeat protein